MNEEKKSRIRLVKTDLHKVFSEEAAESSPKEAPADAGMAASPAPPPLPPHVAASPEPTQLHLEKVPEAGTPPATAGEPPKLQPAVQETARPVTAPVTLKPMTARLLQAVTNLLAVEPGPDGPPGLMESDPLTPSRFQTKTKKLLSKRLERSQLIRPLAPFAVVVEHLDASYQGQQVLYDVSFGVKQGEILAILGGSGSGKTTLLKHLIGLLRPTRGRVQIDGQDIARLEGDDLALVLKSTGMLFQYSALFNSMTIGENLSLPLREYTDLPEHTIRAIVRLKLALVGLAGIEDRMPSELSGGMKKRAALARALALDPHVLFFDEPGSGLDPIAAAALDALIIHLNRSFGTSMVIVTHDLENAFNVAHRILMLDRGHVSAFGTPAEIRASKDPWVLAFLARRSPARDALDEGFFGNLGARAEASVPAIKQEQAKP